MKGIGKKSWGSLRKAGELYSDPELKKWCMIRRTRFATQLQFVDAITGRYRDVMSTLPPGCASAMHYILLSYKDGIRPIELARLLGKSQNHVSSTLAMLRKHGLVSRRQGKNKREAIYYVCDLDFLRVAAIRWDDRFHAFLEANRDREDEDIVDEFIDNTERV